MRKPLNLELIFVNINKRVMDIFTAAAERIRLNTLDLTQEQMLTLYGLYKQATVGDCTLPEPGLLDFKAKAKWTAWNERKGLKKEVAKKVYVACVEEYIWESMN
jgi:diazepam-binding inhibitor (GABA receptor modulating acyl-CoA-binding protein)